MQVTHTIKGCSILYAVDDESSTNYGVVKLVDQHPQHFKWTSPKLHQDSILTC